MSSLLSAFLLPPAGNGGGAGSQPFSALHQLMQAQALSALAQSAHQQNQQNAALLNAINHQQPTATAKTSPFSVDTLLARSNLPHLVQS